MKLREHLNYLKRDLPSPRHTVLKLSKANTKEFSRYPKGEKIKGDLPKNPIRLPVEPYRPKEWPGLLKILKERDCPPRVDPEKLSFR